VCMCVCVCARVCWRRMASCVVAASLAPLLLGSVMSHTSPRCRRCCRASLLPNAPGTEMGLHVTSHTFIDPEVLLDEFEKSADLLTHGLTCEWASHACQRHTLDGSAP
jgi:hypothetical protein